MKTVGIKQLKARLSEYLRWVRSGETFLVTDRDEVVAELRPARTRPAPPDELDEVLAALAESGEVTRASLSKVGWGWAPRGLGLPHGTARRLLEQSRAERSGPD
ncbi:MAG: type II toxin-antitoxin system Phd/YefM family antitoxin [Gemmatimonadetes bacterium]|nr:type II toxin-antitoxin system Phd/YefM family antitoxin [Gemmatimonadota bacterium]